MNSFTENTLDFLGCEIACLQSEDGAIYVLFGRVCEILGVDPERGIHDLESLPPTRLLTAEDVGRILGIDAKTVNKLAKEGKMGCIEITEQKRLFTKELLDEFIKGQTCRRHYAWDAYPDF